MKKKNQPHPLAVRKTCEEITHEVYLRLKYLLNNQELDKKEVSESVHRVLENKESQSLIDFTVEDIVHGIQKRYPQIVCTHVK